MYINDANEYHVTFVVMIGLRLCLGNPFRPFPREVIQIPEKHTMANGSIIQPIDEKFFSLLQ